jgi:methyl-accepting chemotaxis protein
MAYKRSIFLINKGFQFRFSFYVCSWLFVLTLVYPLVIHTLFGYLIRYVSLDPFGPPLEGLLKTRREVLALIVLFQLLFGLVTFLISIFVSHRVAGPLFKLRNYLRDAKGGSFKEPLRFRKTDYFQELAAGFNEMADGIREVLAKNAEQANAAAQSVEKAMKHANGESKRELEAALAVLQEIGRRVPAEGAPETPPAK